MRTKTGQISIFVIVAVVLVALILFIVILKSAEEPEKIIVECNEDSDCVPNECCNSDSCVGLDDRPDCSDVDCVPWCESYASDGNWVGCAEDRQSCGCVNNVCEVK